MYICYFVKLSNTDESEWKPSDRDLSKLAAAVGYNWEMLAPPLGIKATEIDDVKQSNQSTLSNILHMFYLWRNRDQKARLSYLLQLVQNFSSTISVDMATVKGTFYLAFT